MKSNDVKKGHYKGTLNTFRCLMKSNNPQTPQRFGPQKTLLQALVEGFLIFYALFYALFELRLINPFYIDKVSRKYQ